MRQPKVWMSYKKVSNDLSRNNKDVKFLMIKISIGDSNSIFYTQKDRLQDWKSIFTEVQNDLDIWTTYSLSDVFSF